MSPCSFIVLLAAIGVTQAQLQGMRSNRIWASIVIQTFGERVPILSPEISVLTPLGAQQAFQSGDFYRQRYINPSHGFTGIQNISPDQVSYRQTKVMTDSNLWNIQSAQAFMNGIYPSTTKFSGDAANSTQNTFANGTAIFGPLNGTQYPYIYSPTFADPNSILLNGDIQCNAHNQSVVEWLQYPETQEVNRSTLDFYSSLSDVMSGAVPNTKLDYSNAYDIWEFLSFQLAHNKTVFDERGSSNDLAEARRLADSYTLNTLTNTSSSISLIAGQTLAYAISDTLDQHVYSGGVDSKLTALFTSHEQYMSFAALLNLTVNYPDFAGMPNLGASFAVELYSEVMANGNATVIFPSDPAEFYVRVVWRNSSDPSTEAIAYPMTSISRENSGDGVAFTVFQDKLQSWGLGSPLAWCLICESAAMFCPLYTGIGLPDSTSDGDNVLSRAKSGLNPVVAGVIGAMVTLAFLLLLLALSMVLLGVRFRRDGGGAFGKGAKAYDPSSPASRKARNSGLGGFKGDEKLASDIDLPHGSLVGGAAAMPSHHRTASWEMKGGKKATTDANGDSGGSVISRSAGISVTHHTDDEQLDLGNLKAVETRESV